MLLLWLWSLSIRDVSFIDAFWAYGMVLLAAPRLAYRLDVDEWQGQQRVRFIVEDAET